MFRAWVLAGAAMYAVPLRVPRVFYINSTLPPDAAGSPAAQPLGGVRVRRTLPFGREPLHLYQACILVNCSMQLCPHSSSPWGMLGRFCMSGALGVHPVMPCACVCGATAQHCHCRPEVYFAHARPGYNG